MALYIDENADITLTQGDSGEITISGLNANENAKVYFAIQTLKRNPIGNELMVQSNFNESVIFILTADYTDLLEVPANREFEIYQYGIKICTDTSEQTVMIANNDYGQVNRLIVYPKKVEGV